LIFCAALFFGASIFADAPAGKLEAVMNETIDAATLAKDFPPRLHDDNKKIVFGMSCPAGAVHAGKVGVSRWKALSLPAEFPAGKVKIESVAGFFTYDAPAKGVIAQQMNRRFARR
jgi:hypothetical protein